MLRVESSPGNPKIWSPCRCEMKRLWSLLMRALYLLIWSCVPSPQSIIKSFSCRSTSCEGGLCNVVGMADPQPRMVTSNLVISAYPDQFMCLETQCPHRILLDECNAVVYILLNDGAVVENGTQQIAFRFRENRNIWQGITLLNGKAQFIHF